MKFKSYVFRIVIVIAFLVVLPSFVVSQSDDIPEISTSTPEDTIKDVPELLTDEQITDDGPIGSNGKILTITGEQVDDDPRTWKYFRIAASVENDSLFIWVQDDMEISPKLGSYFITVDLRNPGNEIAFIGSEDNPLKLVSWGQLSNRVQSGLINFTGAAKENLNPTAPNFASVFTDVIKKIRVSDAIAPPKRFREIRSGTAYINPYFQVFGGEHVGFPIKSDFGLSFGLGNQYSGPMESEAIGAKFHLLGASIGVVTRILEFTHERGSGVITNGSDDSPMIADYNNIFLPHFALEFNYVIPFGNFFEVGFFTEIDSGNAAPPVQVRNKGTSDPNDFMPNLVVQGNHFNWEFRYPFRTFGSTRAKVYVAKYLGETHVGFSGREMKLANSVFDVRINAMVSSPTRNFQILFETLISDIAQGFANTSFAFGPSIRLGTKNDGKFGALTILLNMRWKIGDIFVEQ
ncbi:MAG: hypothetical protein UZ04_CHB001001150 [Chlorobi bacterium OLB4]|jgi:hypothetical protein|nr:MAG: hypothetical protein UZ04_CHB001001150 [Chlorobi bacterium OLB4]MBW7855085.1 hypothetical protein [Ignavibacteria bacterium]